MDDQLLQELYGVGGEEYYSQDDTLIKEAQAELIEAVADEAGVDLNEMDDDELEKFASYVLSPEEAYADEAYADEAYADEAYAEADQMGRVMAHAYADEQMKIASAMELDHAYAASLEKVAHTWDMMKIAAEEQKFTDRTIGDVGRSVASRASKMTGYRDIRKAMELAKVEREHMRAMRPQALKAYKSDLKDKTKAFKELSAKQRKAMMLAEIRNPAGGELLSTYSKPKPGLAGLFGGRTYHDVRRAPDAIARRQATKALALRGAGKAGLTLTALGAAGYGASKLRDR